MDWNVASHLRPIHENSLNHMVYNFGFHDHYPPVAEVVVAAAHPVVVAEKNKNYHHQHDHKKKRMTSEQLDSLERSFREEIKLDPDRKMQLARELGLPPRQVAIWFQNRRARWKAKQLEDLYESLKQQFDVVSREKQKLQQEVSALKAILHEQAQKINSGEETNESASVENGTSFGKTCGHENHVNYVLNNSTTGDYNLMVQPHPHNVMAFWSHQLPNSYPN